MDKVRINKGSSNIEESARKKTTVVWSCEEKRSTICVDKGTGDGGTG